MRKKKVKLKEALFFTGYGIYLISCILATSFYYKYIIGYKINVILSIALVFLLIKELTEKKITKKSLRAVFILVFLFGLTLLSDQGIGYSSVIYLLLLSFSARDINFETIARFTIWLSAALFLFIVGSAFMGIIPNEVSAALKGTVHYLGFRYSLYPATIVTNITLLLIYLKKSEIKVLELLALLCVNTIMYILTISRLNYYITIALFVTAFLLKYDFNLLKNKVLTFSISISYIISLLFSLYVTIFYNSNNAFTNHMNMLSEGRFALQQRIIGIYGISLLGKEVEWSGNALNAYGYKSTNAYLYADSLYINMALKYGLVILIVLIVCLTIGMFKLRNNNDIYGLYIMGFLAVHGLIDDLIQYSYYNTFLLLVGCTIIGIYKSGLSSDDRKKRAKHKKHHMARNDLIR